MEAPTRSMYLALFLLSLILSSALVPILRKIAFKFSILDRPNQSHKTHLEVVPYLGGLAIVIPILLWASVGSLVIFEDTDYLLRIVTFLIASVALACVGLYDDIKNLSPLSKFLTQFLAAVIITFLLDKRGIGISIFDNEIVNVQLSIFWLVGVTNAFNFIDNLDGAAAGITLVASITLFILSFWGNQYLIALLSIALAGTSFGFLVWNLHPAKIYLGDSGALFVGFTLAVSLLQFDSNVESRFVSALIPVFILALPIIDTSVAVVSRKFRGISIFQGGRDHLSHRLISLGFNRQKTAYILLSLSALFSSLTLLMSIASNHAGVGIACMGLLFMSFLVIWFLTIEVNP